MKINLELTCEDKRWHPYLKSPYFKTSFFEDNLKRALHARNFPKTHPTYQTNYELHLLLTNNKQLQKLNKEFRGKDKVTNILSFPASQLYHSNRKTLFLPHDILGDMALSFERIKEEAIQQNKFFEHHLCHLLLHSLLHLVGYDHIEKEEAEQMEKLEIKWLAYYDIPNPYSL